MSSSLYYFAWRDQMWEWRYDLDATEVQVLINSKDTMSVRSRFVVVSYNLLTKHEEFQIGSDGSSCLTVVLDESQFINGQKSQRSVACLKI